MILNNLDPERVSADFRNLHSKISTTKILHKKIPSLRKEKGFFL